MKTVTIKQFKEDVKTKSVESYKVLKNYTIEDTDEGSTFIITDETFDRENDVIVADGLDISNFLKNPVVLWGHDASDLPIGKCVSIMKQNNAWIATVEFVPSDYPYIGPKAEAVRRSIKDGFLSAVSIGFIPKEWEFNDEGGIIFTKTELSEFSIVTVPCNPSALVVSRDLTSTDQPLVPEETDSEEEATKNQDINKTNRQRYLAILDLECE